MAIVKFEMPESEIPVGRKGHVKVDPARIPWETVGASIMTRGMRLIFGDACAGNDGTESAVKVRDAWYKGDNRTPGRTADPTLRFLREIVAEWIVKHTAVPNRTEAKRMTRDAIEKALGPKRFAVAIKKAEAAAEAAKDPFGDDDEE